MTIQPTEYLRDLATRIRKVPVCHGVDGYDIDTLREVSLIIVELEKANVAYVDANTALIDENKALRQKLFPYADATEISGISWDGKYLIGDKASIKFFHEMKNRGEQIDVYKRAYDQNLAAKDAEIASANAELERLRRECSDGLDALTVIDEFWEASPYPENRKHLSPAEQISSLDNELNAAHDENARLRGIIEEAQRCLEDEPEYHSQGMGCGLEDRGITDRYAAMEHGWEKAMERVFGENIEWAKEALARAALTPEASK